MCVRHTTFTYQIPFFETHVFNFSNGKTEIHYNTIYNKICKDKDFLFIFNYK